MKKIVINLLFLLGNLLYAHEGRIKVYAFYTESHRELVNEWFLPSLRALDEFEIILVKFDQACPSGAFMQEGWIATMHYKIDLIIRAIEENPGAIFIHADVDTQYFGVPFADIIKKEMINCDIAFQKENQNGEVCCGFFACWGNERTLALWRWVKETMSQATNDQVCINDMLLGSNTFGVVWKHLPDSFFGAATLKPGGWQSVWQPGKGSIPLPKSPIMHHANYTVGVPNKIAQMKMVRLAIAALRNR